MLRCRFCCFRNLLTCFIAMTRSLLTFLLLLAGTAGASAQTTPTTPARTKAAAPQPASKAQPAAAAKTTSQGTMADLPTSTKGQTQSIYAAPGQPIVVPDGKVGPYDGPAAGRTRHQKQHHARAPLAIGSGLVDETARLVCIWAPAGSFLVG